MYWDFLRYLIIGHCAVSLVSLVSQSAGLLLFHLRSDWLIGLFVSLSTKSLNSWLTDHPNSESELLSGMSFLYENYNEDAWYWELVEVIRKLLLTCGIILIGRESRTYVGLASICSGLFAIAFAFRKPIRDKFEDKLQLTSLLVIFLNLGIGVILKIPKESVPSDVDQYVDTLLVNILVIGANVLVILLVVGMYAIKIIF